MGFAQRNYRGEWREAREKLIENYSIRLEIFRSRAYLISQSSQMIITSLLGMIEYRLFIAR